MEKKHFLFIISVLSILILNSSHTLALPVCDCPPISNCGPSQYCAPSLCSISGSFDSVCLSCKSNGVVCNNDEECCLGNCAAKSGSTYHCCDPGDWWVTNQCVQISEFPTALVGIIAVVVAVLGAVFIPKIVSKAKSRKSNKK